MCPVCGIAGLYSPSAPPNPELVDAMRAAIVHRGPDEGSTDAFGPCVLGHQRLRVIDLETGYQPVTNERGDVICVFNGDIDNFPELRRLLQLPGVHRDVDLDAVDAYLALQYVPGERTGLRGIHRLLPGHVLVAEHGSERTEPYWRPELRREHASETEWLERVRTAV